MRKIICLAMTVCMLFACIPAWAQETPEQQAPEQGIPVDGDITEVPAWMIDQLDAEEAAAMEERKAEWLQSDGVTLQERAFDGYSQEREDGDLKITVEIDATQIVLGDTIDVKLHFETPYPSLYLVRRELIYDVNMDNGRTTAAKTGTSYYTKGYFHWTYTPTQVGNVIFSILLTDAYDNQIFYLSPTIMVKAAETECFEGRVIDGSLFAIIKVRDTAVSVGEPVVVECYIDTDAASLVYGGDWKLVDYDDNKLHQQYLLLQFLQAAEVGKWFTVEYTPEQPGLLRFSFDASDRDGNEIDINSPLITVYPFIDVSLDKESAMFGETVTATYDVEWPGKSPYLQGYWTFTDENGNSTNKWVTVSSSGGTVSYTTDKPGTLKFTVIATLNGEDYTRSTEAITVEPYNISVWLDKSSVAFGDEVTANYSVKWYGETPEVEACWCIYADSYDYNTWEDVETSTGSFTYTAEYGNRVRFFVRGIAGEKRAWKYSSYCDFTGTPLRDDPVHVVTAEINQTSATIGNTITGTYSIGNYTGAEDGYYYAEWQVYADGEYYYYTYGDDELPGTSGTVSFHPFFGDEVRLYVYAHDQDFWSSNASDWIPINGTPEFDPPKIDIKLDKSSVNTGEAVTATYTVTGGPEDMEIDISWNVVFDEPREDGAISTGIKWEDNVARNGTSTLVVPFGPTLECEVCLWHDKLPNGYYYESKSIPVYGDPMYAINLILDKESVMAGEYVTATYESVGYPDGDVSVNWYFYDENEDRISSVYADDDGGLSGTSTVYVPFGRKLVCNAYIYHDSLPSAEAYKSIPITGYPLYDPLKITASLDKTTVQSGSPLTLTYSVTGGKAPLDIWMRAETITADYSEFYQIANRFDLPASGKEVVIPYLGDEVSVSLDVTDADGNSASWYGTNTITGAPEAQETRLTVTADKTEVIVGEPITVTYNFSTGNVPLGEGSYYYWSVSDQDGDGYAERLEEGNLTEKSGTLTYIPQDYAGETLYLIMYIRNVYGQEHYNWDIYATIVNDPSRLPGDADDNGSVDIYDALTILKHLSGEAVDINLTNAEVNRDSQVDVQDAILIMEKSAGWNVTLK